MAKPPSAVAEIAALVPKSRRGMPWWERCTPAVTAALPGILKGWREGAFGPHRYTAARAIAAWLKQHGVEIGEQGVVAWLRRNPQ